MGRDADFGDYNASDRATEVTAVSFEKRMREICAKAKTLSALEALARALIEEELGANAYNCVPGIDQFCRRARELVEKKDFGPPTKKTIGKIVGGETAL